MQDKLIYSGREYDEYRRPDGTTYRIKTEKTFSPAREHRKQRERLHKIVNGRFMSPAE